MPKEIERKFLVKGEFKQFAISKSRIIQGYLSSLSERAVRIRIRDKSGYLTIKGKANAAGTIRSDWEYEIPLYEAEELLQLCEQGIIEKFRYLVKAGNHTYEVDEFYGENEGLVVAEIELQSEEEDFIKPDWLGKEVTGDTRYYNSGLAGNPYTKWSKSD